MSPEPDKSRCLVFKAPSNERLRKCEVPVRSWSIKTLVLSYVEMIICGQGEAGKLGHQCFLQGLPVRGEVFWGCGSETEHLLSPRFHHHH